MRMRRILSTGVLLATAALAMPSAHATTRAPSASELAGYTAPYVYVYPEDRLAPCSLEAAEFAQKNATAGPGWRRVELDAADRAGAVEIRNVVVRHETIAAPPPPQIAERTPMDWGRDYGRLLILLAVPAAFLGLHLHLSRRAYIVPPST